MYSYCWDYTRKHLIPQCKNKISLRASNSLIWRASSCWRNGCELGWHCCGMSLMGSMGWSFRSTYLYNQASEIHNHQMHPYPSTQATY